MEDRSWKIIEDIKWFMFGDGRCDIVKENDCGFKHCLEFFKWNGDSCSFVVSDGENQYNIICQLRNENRIRQR